MGVEVTPNAGGQSQAQQRADRIAAFRAELAALESDGVLTLTPEQHGPLEAHLETVLAGLARKHGVDISEAAKRVSWGMRLASLLGGIAFFAALVLFLHRIWGALPTWGHVGILTGIPLLLLVATELTARRGAHSYYLSLLAFAAGTALVMQLNTVGAIFNLAPSPHALLAWAAFAILVAYACGVRLLLGCGLVLLCAYGASWWAALAGSHWAEIFQHAAGFLPVAAVCYALPWLVRTEDPRGFGTVYRVCGAAVALTALLVLSKVGHHCCSVLPSRSIEPIYQMIGLGLSPLVIWHGLRLGRGGLVNVGAVGFVVFLLVRLHAWWWDWMPKYLFFLLIGITAMVLLVVFRRVRARLLERLAGLTAMPCDDGRGGASVPANRPGRPHSWLGSTLVPPKRVILLAAAGAVLVVSNSWALVSVWRNRSASPGGTMELSERELGLPFLIGDSTALALHLRWEARSSDPENDRAPDWLDAAKLAELGFDCRVPLTSPQAREHYRTQPSKLFHVVLELADEAQSKPGRRNGQGTRLSAVDAGRNAQRLRNTYPHEARFIITRALVRPSFEDRNRDGRPLPEPRLRGWIGPLVPSALFVPKPWCRLLQPLRPRDDGPEAVPDSGPRFGAQVSWGTNYEPWVREVRLLPPTGRP